MTDLYRHDGSAPAPLPLIVHAPNGDAYTEPYAAEDMAMLGLVLADEMPYFDPATQAIVWDADAEGWRVDDLPTPPEPTHEEMAARVTAERDRRIDVSFEFTGKRFQCRASDRENIAGASQLAFMALVVGGAAPGNLRWADDENDFVWIAEDNSLVPMDAQTVIAFGKAAASRKQVITFAARAIKDLEPIPADYADDARWPAS